MSPKRDASSGNKMFEVKRGDDVVKDDDIIDFPKIDQSKEVSISPRANNNSNQMMGGLGIDIGSLDA